MEVIASLPAVGELVHIDRLAAGLVLVVEMVPNSRQQQPANTSEPLFGGGDEIFGLTRLGVDHSLAWGSALVLVFALAVPPVVKIYTLIENRRKPLWIIGLMLTPFLLVGVIVFGILQGLVLKNGISDDYWIMGSPIIVTIWLFVSAGLFAMFGKYIVTLLEATGDELVVPRPHEMPDYGAPPG